MSYLHPLKSQGIQIHICSNFPSLVFQRQHKGKQKEKFRKEKNGIVDTSYSGRPSYNIIIINQTSSILFSIHVWCPRKSYSRGFRSFKGKQQEEVIDSGICGGRCIGGRHSVSDSGSDWGGIGWNSISHLFLSQGYLPRM